MANVLKYPRKLFKKGKATKVPEQDILVIIDKDKLQVISDVCPHLGGPLSKGKFCKNSKTLKCPWHGYKFSLENLEMIENPNDLVWAQAFGEKTSMDFKLTELKCSIEHKDLIIVL